MNKEYFIVCKNQRWGGYLKVKNKVQYILYKIDVIKEEF